MTFKVNDKVRVVSYPEKALTNFGPETDLVGMVGYVTNADYTFIEVDIPGLIDPHSPTSEWLFASDELELVED